MSVKTVIDRNQVLANQKRAVRIGNAGAAFLYDAVTEDLLLRLSAVNRNFRQAVVFAPSAVPENKRALQIRQIDRIDWHGATDDAPSEIPILEHGRYDLAISLLMLHETNDTPGIISQIRRSLTADGLFIACLPGGDTLHELRSSLLYAEADLTGSAHARVLPFIEVRDAGALLQRAGFALPVADRESVTVRYDTMFDLMRDLRAMGAANTLASRSKGFTPRAVFERAAHHYAENFADPDGRIRATFTFIWMSGWSPHESQQKPLKPGSASARLADVLGDKSRET